MKNRNALTKLLVGNDFSDRVIRYCKQDKGFKYTVVSSTGNKRGVIAYYHFDTRDQAFAAIRKVYSTVCWCNCVTVIIEDMSTTFTCDTLDFTKEAAEKHASGYFWKRYTEICGPVDSDDETMCISAMDANFYDYIMKSDDDVKVKLGIVKYVYNKLGETYKCPSSANIPVSTIKQLYDRAYTYANALGWSFEKPLSTSIRTVDEFNTMPIMYGRILRETDADGNVHFNRLCDLDAFVTNSYAGATLFQGDDQYDEKDTDKQRPLPLYLDAAAPGSATVAKCGINSHYKYKRLTAFKDVYEFNNHVETLSKMADYEDVGIADYFEPGYGVCPFCGRVVRTEGDAENRWCWCCDAEIPGYVVTNAYYDDSYNDDYESREDSYLTDMPDESDPEDDME